MFPIKYIVCSAPHAVPHMLLSAFTQLLLIDLLMDMWATGECENQDDVREITYDENDHLHRIERQSKYIVFYSDVLNTIISSN